ncbi:MAG: hypothetical protein U0441_11200 [Polyangiaceae bacterium]
METLADRIAREGPLNELDAVGWAIRLAKRIESMHALGVTHGSVSPQCVQIEGKDRTARAYLVDVRRTSTNVSYHSPERLNGGGLSVADDTWALASTLYCALTGSPPFSGANDAEVKQKVLTSSPAPLAVFDVGDDDLQRVFDDAFAREPSQRTSSIAALRRALEEWHPDPNVGGLPGLEDEDTGGGDDDDEEDARTIMRTAPAALAKLDLGPPVAGGRAPMGGPAAAPAPRAGAPIPAPRAPIPAPRASSPGGGAPAAPVGGGLAPFLQPRPGAAARAGAGPSGGLPAPIAPAPRASSPGVRAPSAPGGFPAPLGPPPELRDPPPHSDDDDEDEDARTMMRAVPEHLSAVLGPRDAGRSGAFAAVPAGQSGAFPALASPASSVGADDDDDAENEATRMMPSPSIPGADDDEDDEQKTLMRTSMPPDEVERIQAAGMPPPRPAAGAAAEEPQNFASTVSFEMLGIASPLADPAASPGAALAPASNASAPMMNEAAPPLAAPAAAPMVIPGTGPMVAPPPRRGGLVWVAVIVLLALAAAATFLVLKMR